MDLLSPTLAILLGKGDFRTWRNDLSKAIPSVAFPSLLHSLPCPVSFPHIGLTALWFWQASGELWPSHYQSQQHIVKKTLYNYFFSSCYQFTYILLLASAHRIELWGFRFVIEFIYLFYSFIQLGRMIRKKMTADDLLWGSSNTHFSNYYMEMTEGSNQLILTRVYSNALGLES